MSARRVGDPNESRGGVKTRGAAAPHSGQVIDAWAVPIAAVTSAGPCSGQR
jgi:hypothetical protein